MKVFSLLDPELCQYLCRKISTDINWFYFWFLVKKVSRKKIVKTQRTFFGKETLLTTYLNEEKNNFSNCFIFYCSFLTVWQNEFLIAQNEQFDWHVWFCSFYSFRKCHEKENRGKKSADFCSCCCQFYKCFFDDWDSTRTHCQSALLLFSWFSLFLKHFFLRHEQPNYLQSGL